MICYSLERRLEILSGFSPSETKDFGEDRVAITKIYNTSVCYKFLNIG